MRLFLILSRQKNPQPPSRETAVPETETYQPDFEEETTAAYGSLYQTFRPHFGAIFRRLLLPLLAIGVIVGAFIAIPAAVHASTTHTDCVIINSTFEGSGDYEGYNFLYTTDGRTYNLPDKLLVTEDLPSQNYPGVTAHTTYTITHQQVTNAMFHGVRYGEPDHWRITSHWNVSDTLGPLSWPSANRTVDRLERVPAGTPC